MRDNSLGTFTGDVGVDVSDQGPPFIACTKVEGREGLYEKLCFWNVEKKHWACLTAEGETQDVAVANLVTAFMDLPEGTIMRERSNYTLYFQKARKGEEIGWVKTQDPSFGVVVSTPLPSP